MKISVVGLGKLGLPIYQVLKKNGYKVKGIDKNKPPMDFSELGFITFIVVPTPSDEQGKFSSDYVENVLKNIPPPQIVSIVSTLYPGETDRLQKKYPHLTLIYNPTFVALGTVEQDFTHPDFILIGSNNVRATELLKSIFNKICNNPKFCVLTPLEAEITKLSVNCYITTKITYANQIGNLCYKLGIKPDKILEAVGTDHRIGKDYFKAGLGYGGPCFPRDNIALSKYFADNHTDPSLFRLINNLNRYQIEKIVQRILKLKPKSVGFESLSYKKGTDCQEQSQLLMIHDWLKKIGIKVKIGKGDVNFDWGGMK